MSRKTKVTPQMWQQLTKTQRNYIYWKVKVKYTRHLARQFWRTHPAAQIAGRILAFSAAAFAIIPMPKTIAGAIVALMVGCTVEVYAYAIFTFVNLGRKV